MIPVFQDQQINPITPRFRKRVGSSKNLGEFIVGSDGESCFGGIADLSKVGKEEDAYTERVRCEEVKVVEEAFVEKRGFRERRKQYHF